MTYKLEDLLSNLPDTSSGDSIDDILIDRMNEAKLPEYMLTDPEFVGYDDLDFQESIYKWVLNGMAPGTLKDFGCGRGDFYKLWPDGYFGIDSNPVMINAATQKYPSISVTNADWFDVNETTKYTICIGSLNVDTGHDKWTHFAHTLNHAISTTIDCVIFVLNTAPQPGILDYDLPTVVQLASEYPFYLDCSMFEGICKLQIFCQKFR